jgi:hypothetical protein
MCIRREAILVAAALSAGALATVSPAVAGVVRGQLWASREAARLAARMQVAVPASTGTRAPVSRVTGARPRTVPAPSTTPPPDPKLARLQSGVADAVVYVEKIPDRVHEKLGRRGWFARVPPLPAMSHRGRRFVPRVLAIPAGDSVAFANLDRVYHNTFSVSAARRFDLGKYAPGRRDTVRFPRAGAVTLHCDIHPEEIGFVMVVPNRAFARPDSLGAFRLPKLPPGRYRVRTWHPRLGELSRTIEMPKRGDVALELAF